MMNRSETVEQWRRRVLLKVLYAAAVVALLLDAMT